MRPTLIALVVVLLTGSCACRDATAEQGSRWWPFGRSNAEESQASDPFEAAAAEDSNPVEQPSPQPETPVDDESDQRWMIDSRRGKVSWPRLHLPEVQRPQLPQVQLWPRKSDVDADRNAWVEEEPPVVSSSPWQAVTGGARRFGDGTRAAWDKTVDVLTPGGNSRSTSSRIARRDENQPWWKRMFAVEDRKPQGAQTVTEWMAQDRLDP